MAGAALVLVLGALAAVRRVRTVVAGFLRTALGEARSVHARPARALALWGGALAFPALQSAAKGAGGADAADGDVALAGRAVIR
ncbi:hypothetical protein STENM223S_05577 [Streptomyces tendae]